QCAPLLSPDIGDRARQRAVRGLLPQLHATLLQPGVHRGQVGKARHPLQDLMAGVLNVLLDLSLLPTRCRIAEAVHCGAMGPSPMACGSKTSWLVMVRKRRLTCRSLPRPTWSTAVFVRRGLGTVAAHASLS